MMRGALTVRWSWRVRSRIMWCSVCFRRHQSDGLQGSEYPGKTRNVQIERTMIFHFPALARCVFIGFRDPGSQQLGHGIIRSGHRRSTFPETPSVS